jgi:hypothetical protein
LHMTFCIWQGIVLIGHITAFHFCSHCLVVVCYSKYSLAGFTSFPTI